MLLDMKEVENELGYHEKIVADVMQPQQALNTCDHLLSQDERYVDCIGKGPHIPRKAITDTEGSVGDEQTVPKPQAEWTDEDIEQVHKDKKAMNILFNGLDGDMFDNVINCKTAKNICDTIQIICDGTEQAREKKM
ncbi:hypothetical protein AgCh_016053 [Apium graveolens]